MPLHMAQTLTAQAPRPLQFSGHALCAAEPHIWLSAPTWSPKRSNQTDVTS